MGRLMLVKSIAECSKWSILQYFRHSLSYHLSIRFLFCLFLSGRLRQVLLFIECSKIISNTFIFPISNKMLVFRAEIPKMLFRIANRVDPDLHCLSRPFWKLVFQNENIAITPHDTQVFYFSISFI